MIWMTDLYGHLKFDELHVGGPRIRLKMNPDFLSTVH
jgi:hypothetical protein